MYPFQTLEWQSAILMMRRVISSDTYTSVGRDSAVGTATCYRLDGPGIESQRGRELLHASRPALGSTQPPTQCLPRLSGGKMAGTWLWPPTASNAKDNKRAQLYIYFPSRPSWSILVWTLAYLYQHSSIFRFSLFSVFCEIFPHPTLHTSAFDTAQLNNPRSHQHMTFI
jgi:hypothetical protein